MDDLPLLDLFTKLREAGLSVGIDEYRLVLRALQLGFGVTDEDALARLCRTLWVKSKEDERTFNDLFERMMPQLVASKSTFSSQLTSPQSETTSAVPPQTTAPPPTLPMPTVEPTAPGLALVPTSPTLTIEPSVSTPTTLSSELTLEEDEILIAQALLYVTSSDEEIPYNHFSLTAEYLPVHRRQMKQSWRHLRHPVREGPPIELDIEATVNQIGRHGIFLELALVPRRINRAELLLLLDQDGSMVPFHALSRRLAETAARGGRLGKSGKYYFHNCPIDYLYHDPNHQQAEPIQDILDGLHSRRTTVLIFSDAGAARGGFNRERIDLTRKFLERLKQHVRYIAWLNPMPRLRWHSTTAREVARLIPMFEISRQGLHDAIDVLRGRSVNLEEQQR